MLCKPSAATVNMHTLLVKTGILGHVVLTNGHRVISLPLSKWNTQKDRQTDWWKSKHNMGMSSQKCHMVRLESYHGYFYLSSA